MFTRILEGFNKINPVPKIRLSLEPELHVLIGQTGQLPNTGTNWAYIIQPRNSEYHAFLKTTFAQNFSQHEKFDKDSKRSSPSLLLWPINRSL